MFCTNCGNQNAANAKFCKTCGTAVTGNFAHQPTAQKPLKPVNKALFAIPAVVLAVVVAGVLLLPGFGNGEPTPIAPTAPTAANPSDSPNNAPPTSPSLQGRAAQAQIDTAIAAVEDFLRQLHTDSFLLWDFNRNGIPKIVVLEWPTADMYMFNGQEYERVADFDLSDAGVWLILADVDGNIIFMDSRMAQDGSFTFEFSYFDIITRQPARPLASVSVHFIEEIEDVTHFQIITLSHLTGEETTVQREITEETGERLFEEFGESFDYTFSGIGLAGAENWALLSSFFDLSPTNGTMTVADMTLFLGYSMREFAQELWSEIQRATEPAAAVAPATVNPLPLISGTYQGMSPNGWNGDIRLDVVVDITGRIVDIFITESNETVSFADPAFNHLIPAVLATQSTGIDIFTGATYTSTAFLEAVEDALVNNAGITLAELRAGP
ncbi:MAG: FMN-binding protein [Defluviitaleaceae bacterium]|nr:FMN-binding protein [Defluviitaleaceae bacterium]